MADSLGVDVGERAEKLVDVELDLENGHDGLHLVEIARSPVNGFRHELEYEVEVNFVFLWLTWLVPSIDHLRVLADTYPLAVVVEEGLEFDDVGMSDNAHDLQLTVLS